MYNSIKKNKIDLIWIPNNSLRHIHEKMVRDFAMISMYFQIFYFRLSLPQ